MALDASQLRFSCCGHSSHPEGAPLLSLYTGREPGYAGKTKTYCKEKYLQWLNWYFCAYKKMVTIFSPKYLVCKRTCKIQSVQLRFCSAYVYSGTGKQLNWKLKRCQIYVGWTCTNCQVSGMHYCALCGNIQLDGIVRDIILDNLRCIKT